MAKHKWKTHYFPPHECLFQISDRSVCIITELPIQYHCGYGYRSSIFGSTLNTCIRYFIILYKSGQSHLLAYATSKVTASPPANIMHIDHDRYLKILVLWMYLCIIDAHSYIHCDSNTPVLILRLLCHIAMIYANEWSLNAFRKDHWCCRYLLSWNTCSINTTVNAFWATTYYHFS